MAEISKFSISDSPQLYSSSHTSKGNQMKWKTGNSWLKADGLGYEGLAETVVSGFLKHSNLTEDEFVNYRPVKIEYKERGLAGCESYNFLEENDELIPIERLVRLQSPMGLSEQLGKMQGAENRIQHTVSLIEHFTGIADFGFYLTKMLEIDAFFLNEDRHTNNISIIYNAQKPVGKRFQTCPYYDHGASLFSDTTGDYPMKDDFEACYTKIQAKPFSRDFDEQLDAAQNLYGYHLKFKIKQSDVSKIFNNLWDEYQLSEIYPEEVKRRVDITLRMQARKYSYMFFES